MWKVPPPYPKGHPIPAMAVLPTTFYACITALPMKVELARLWIFSHLMALNSAKLCRTCREALANVTNPSWGSGQLLHSY